MFQFSKIAKKVLNHSTLMRLPCMMLAHLVVFPLDPLDLGAPQQVRAAAAAAATGHHDLRGHHHHLLANI